MRADTDGLEVHSRQAILDELFECQVQEKRVAYKRLNSAETLIQTITTEAPQGHTYCIGLDVTRILAGSPHMAAYFP